MTDRKMIIVVLLLALSAGVSLACAEPQREGTNPPPPPPTPLAAQPAAARPETGPASSPARPQLTLKYRHGASAIAISPDSRLLASSCWNVVRLTDVYTGRLVRIGEVSSTTPNSLAFSPDGKFLMAGTSAGKVEVLDTRTLVVEKVLPATGWSIYALAVSSDSAALACCAGDGTVQLWDLKSAKKLRTFGVQGERMASLAFAPDGRLLAALSRYGRCNVWNVKTGNLAASADRLGDDDSHLVFSRDGATLAIAGDGTVIHLWNFAKDKQPACTRVPDALIGTPRINGTGFSPQEGRPMNAPLGAFAFGPACLSDDLRTAACVLENGSIAIWDIASRRVRTILPKGSGRDSIGDCPYVGCGIRTVSFSPDGRVLAIVSGVGDGCIDVWQLGGKVEAAALKQPIDADEWPGPWGPALNGLRTRLILKPVKPNPEALIGQGGGGREIDQRQIPLAEGVWWKIDLQVQNETNKALTFVWPEIRRSEGITITGENGQPVGYRAVAGDQPVTRAIPMSINPTPDLMTVGAILLGRNHDMSRPGKYRIQFPGTKAAATLRDPLTNPTLPASNVLEFDNQATAPAVGEADVEEILKLIRPVLPGGAKISRTVAGEKPQDWNSTDRCGVLVEGERRGQPFRIYFLPRDWIGVRKWKKERHGNLVVYWQGVLLGQNYKTITETEDVAVLESLQKAGMWTPSLVNCGWDTAQQLFCGRLSQVEMDARDMMEKFCATEAQRNEAVLSLILLGVPAEGLIREYAAKGAGQTREFCISALGHSRAPESRQTLEQALRDPTVSDLGRKYAVMGLEWIADPKSAPVVLSAFDAFDPRKAQSTAATETPPHAAAMMAGVHYQPAAPKILDWMQREPNPYYKTEYAQTLASLRYKPAVPFIEKLCKIKKLNAEWALMPHGYLGDEPEIALLRLTGDWGQEAEGGRLLLLAPEKVQPGNVTFALLIENCGKQVLGVEKFLWGKVWVNGKATQRAPTAYDGPSGPNFGDVWTLPVEVTLTGPGPWKVQYEGGGQLKSNILVLRAAAPGDASLPLPKNSSEAKPEPKLR